MQLSGVGSWAQPLELDYRDYNNWDIDVRDLEDEVDSTKPQKAAHEHSPRFDMILQPETRPISQEQFIAEVKEIYAGLVMVETKCIEVDNAQSSASDASVKVSNAQWQELFDLHRRLLREHLYVPPARELSGAAGSLLERLATTFDKHFGRLSFLRSMKAKHTKRSSVSRVLTTWNLYSYLIELLGKSYSLNIMNTLVEDLLERIEEMIDILFRRFSLDYNAPSLLGRLWDLLHEFPGKRRPPCTTMPWTIWPALVVLWGVCWMFYSPLNAGEPGVDPSWMAYLDSLDSTTHENTFDLGFNPNYPVVGLQEGTGPLEYDPYRVELSVPDPFALDPIMSGQMGDSEDDVSTSTENAIHWSDHSSSVRTTIAPPLLSHTSNAAAPHNGSSNVNENSAGPSPPARVPEREVEADESRKHQCSVCAATFTEERSLIRHCDEKHSASPPKRYYCPTIVCSRHTKGFTRRLGLTRHLARQRGCDKRRAQVMSIEVLGNRRDRSSSATVASEANTELRRPRKKSKTTSNGNSSVGIDAVLARWKEDLKSEEAELETKERELEELKRKMDGLERDVEKRKAVLEDSRKRIRDLEDANGHSQATGSTEP